MVDPYAAVPLAPGTSIRVKGPCCAITKIGLTIHTDRITRPKRKCQDHQCSDHELNSKCLFIWLTSRCKTPQDVFLQKRYHRREATFNPNGRIKKTMSSGSNPKKLLDFHVHRKYSSRQLSVTKSLNRIRL